MKKVGRNDACHCGSGKKYKNCHAQLEEQTKGKNNNLMIGGLALFVILLAVAIFLQVQSSANGAPGEAPAGKVWSQEHGHWHNAE